MTISAIPDASFETFGLPDGGTAEALAGDPGPEWSPPGSPWRFSTHGAGSRAGIARDGAALLALNDPAPYGQQVAFLQQYGVCQQTFTLSAELIEPVEFRACCCQSVGPPGASELELWINGSEFALYVIDNTPAFGTFGFTADWREGVNTILFRQRPVDDLVPSMVLVDMDGVPLAVWLRLVHGEGADMVRMRHSTGSGTVRLVHHG